MKIDWDIGSQEDTAAEPELETCPSAKKEIRKEILKL